MFSYFETWLVILHLKKLKKNDCLNNCLIYYINTLELKMLHFNFWLRPSFLLSHPYLERKSSVYLEWIVMLKKTHFLFHNVHVIVSTNSWTNFF